MKYKTLLTVVCLLGFTLTAIAQSKNRPTVAVLLFDRAQIIDFTGPWETFGLAGYKVFTVSDSKDTIKANMGMKLIPDYTLDESPDADILVIPGGGIPHRLEPDHPMVNWLKEKEKTAKYVLTVCNGAFVLGSAGFSDGLKMTTNAGMIDHLSHFVKGAVPVYDRRFVHDGKFISAGGLTAGIDASLYLISLLDSKGRAQEVANNMEYHWDASGAYVRTKLADFELSMALDFNPPLRKKVVKYEGDENTWLADFIVTRKESLQEFAGQLEDAAKHQNWDLLSENKNEDRKEYEWAYTNHRSEKWNLKAVFSETETENEYRLKINLARQSRSDRDHVYAAIEDYVDALYLVRPERIQRSVHPDLTKKGFGRQRDQSEYSPETIMTFEQLLSLAGRWNAKGTLPEDAPRVIEVYDVQDQTASGKLTAQWGTDYFQLAKYDGRWLIVNIMWQSPPPE